MNLRSSISSDSKSHADNVIPVQPGLSSRRSASKVRCQPRVCGTHSYLDMQKTHFSKATQAQSLGKIASTDTNDQVQPYGGVLFSRSKDGNRHPGILWESISDDFHTARIIRQTLSHRAYFYT